MKIKQIVDYKSIQDKTRFQTIPIFLTLADSSKSDFHLRGKSIKLAISCQPSLIRGRQALYWWENANDTLCKHPFHQEKGKAQNGLR